MSWWNPISWLPEDPVVQCGWRALSVYHNPKDDPYYDFCAWDDNGTTKGSLASKIISLDRWVQQGLEQINLLQSRYDVGSEEWELGEYYKTIWPHVVGYFWEGK